MKKVFGLFLSLIVLMGLWSCEAELPDEPQKPNPEPIPEETGCLTFVSSGESLVALAKVGEPFDISLEYSLDGKSWNSYTIRKAIYLLDGGKLSFRAGETGNERFSKGSLDNYRFIISGSVSAKGNIMSLLDKSCRKNAVPANAFFYLFCDCTGLTEAPKLPATELAEGCYTRMFEGCTNLTKAPALPATNLAKECYYGMFDGCKRLTKSPELPATELAGGCYSSMFERCTNLTEAPELPAAELAKGCYGSMFSLCTGLTKAPELPAMELAEECYREMFVGCKSLTKAPDLPATELASWCYSGMFYGCKSLTKAPDLPATKLTSWCYSGMFDGCKSLTKAPELPATELADVCYTRMFEGCTSLTEAPELPAKELAYECYSNMFNSCTSLTEAPALPATKLAKRCYESMFNSCTSLTKAPNLPATELAGSCYSHMFEGCTNLSKAPDLPATDLDYSCYERMFSGCTNLNYIKALFTDEPSIKTTEGWLSGVAPTGTFVRSKDATWDVRGDDGIPEGWTVESDAGTSDDPQKPNPDEPSYLTFVSSGESTISLIKNGYPDPITLEYSTNDSAWTPYTIGETISLLDGEKLMFRAGIVRNKSFSCRYDGYYNFKILGRVAANGNIMSLLDRKCSRNSVLRYTFFKLFSDCTGLTSAPELPATELAEFCYRRMFYGCTSLTKAPALPATKLAEYCYWEIFEGCTSLTEAPVLPAMELAESCYASMFKGCTNLTEAPVLPATVLARGCYFHMFMGCTSLTKAPELPATNLATNCYNGMFRDCKSLTKTPTLPATELASYCYCHMFDSCTSLTKAPEDLPARKLADFCYWYMFTGCTSLTKAPELPATNLAKKCYSSMFSGCTNLNYVKALFTDEPYIETTADWLSNVAPTGTFVKSKDAKWDVRGSSGIPEGWTIESDAGTSDEPQKPNPDKPSYLTFVSTGESAVSLVKNGEPALITLEYSTNDSAWTPYTIGETISLLDGEKLMFRAGEQGNNFFSSNDENYYNFKITGSVAAKGNIMSLLDRSCHKNAVPRYAFSGLFANCRSLTSAPELPATKLAEKCYSYMFSLCKNLTKAPELPATELAERCYWGMFSGCARLTEAPELPATELALHCYNYMFGICESLTKAPALPATILAEGCYFGMFEYSNLVKAPVLPATELAQSCYRGMFWGCSNLTEAPVLPATELVASCYSNMFGYCTGLTKAPELPATELAASCYYSMFEGCRNLKFVKALFTDKPSGEATKNWLSGVSYTGIFVKSKGATWDVRGDDGIPCRWTIVSDTGTSDDSQKPNPGETGCLTFVSSGGSSVTLVKVGKPYEITLEYSLDGNSWIPYTIGNTLNVIDGWELMFRAGEEGNANFSAGLENNYKFIFSGEIAASGNIMSLLDRSCHKNTVPRYAFSGLFANCRSLISAPELHARELAQDCYSFMFSGCTSLTKAPELPAMELASCCYLEMFEGCTSLTEAPELPATELAEYCYYNIFYGCKNLTEVPALPATELAEGCYGSMFYGCTSLTKAPELPATELDPYCYFEMFKGCTSLNYVKALFIYEPFNGATDNWLLGVSPTGTFVKSKDAKWDVRGSSGIPEGWTIESDAGTSDEPQKPNPDKPSYLTFVSTGESAVSLVKNGEPALITLEYSTNDSIWAPYTIGETISLLDGEKLMFRAGEQGNNFFSSNDENYYNFKITGSVAAKGNIMSLLDRSCHKNRVPRDAFSGLFANCWSLTSAPKLPAMKLDEECYSGMFSGCTNLTSAPELPSMKLAVLCYSGMFNGCTSLTSAPELPSMELAQNCYSYMFSGCTSLTEAPELPSMELADCCYYFMFNGCTSLTKAPALPATELAFDCYNGMFYGCTSLNYVKALFTRTSNGATSYWLSDVSPSGTFVKSRDATWDVRGKDGIPYGWTVVTE